MIPTGCNNSPLVYRRDSKDREVAAKLAQMLKTISQLLLCDACAIDQDITLATLEVLLSDGSDLQLPERDLGASTSVRVHEYEVHSFPWP